MRAVAKGHRHAFSYRFQGPYPCIFSISPPSLRSPIMSRVQTMPPLIFSGRVLLGLHGHDLRPLPGQLLLPKPDQIAMPQSNHQPARQLHLPQLHVRPRDHGLHHQRDLGQLHGVSGGPVLPAVDADVRLREVYHRRGADRAYGAATERARGP